MAVRGAKPKPTPVLEMQGTYQACRHKDTWRAIEGEIIKPDWMKPEAEPYFQYLKETVKGIGCDSSTFSTALATVAEALAERNRLRDMAEETGGPILHELSYRREAPLVKKNPAYTLLMEQDKRVTSLLTEFGLTPSSMSRLRGLDKKADNDDPFAALLGGSDSIQ